MDEQRPTPLVDDLEATRAKLADWFSRRRGTPVEVSDLAIPEATGMSNVTLLFDTRWEQDGQQREEPCVGRLQPQVERPVFPDYDSSVLSDTWGRFTSGRLLLCCLWHWMPRWWCSSISILRHRQ